MQQLQNLLVECVGSVVADRRTYAGRTAKGSATAEVAARSDAVNNPVSAEPGAAKPMIP